MPSAASSESGQQLVAELLSYVVGCALGRSDTLCAGDYDWSQLAMHRWPERVVPR